MIRRFLHRGWTRRLVDDAVGLLPPDDRAALRRHLETCAACRAERRQIEDALATAEHDPIRRAEPPIDATTMVWRVNRAIERRTAGSPEVPAARRMPWTPVWVAAAAVAVIAALAHLKAPVPAASIEAVVPVETIERMERTVDREQTARYLQEAEGVLLTLTARVPACDRSARHREVSAEVRQSRELLARRRLLVLDEAEHLATVRPVLQDVDRVLGEVAALDACARPEELRSIAARIAEERLLMKIDLMARELQG
jgi:hypothetical protein